MKVSIHQPNYIPWLGFFDKINRSDIFVILDDVQYPGNKITSRNIIRNGKGAQYLSVPIMGRRKLICDVLIDNSKPWSKQHFDALFYNYHKMLGWEIYSEELKCIYNKKWSRLIDLNLELINFICNKLKISSNFISTSSLKKDFGKRNQRILNICKYLKADIFLSGSGAENYLDVDSFNRENIQVIFQNYSVPSYRQNPDGTYMSAIDFLLEYGDKAAELFHKGGEGECK